MYASGVYLMTIGILLFALFIFSFFIPGKASGPQSALMVKIEVLLFALWPLITGIGLCIRKNWARISVIVMSVLALVIGIFSVLGFSLFHPAKPYPPGFFIWTISLFFLFFIVIPVLFMVFFSRKSLNEIFEQGEQGIKRPFGITFVAYYQFLGGFCIFMIFSPTFKMPVGPWVLEGTVLSIYWAIISFLSIYIGAGLLRLSKSAWWAGILLHSFNLILGIVNILMVSESTLSMISNQYQYKSAFSFSITQFRIFGAIGLLIPTVILFYLISKKGHFISFSNEPSEH